MPDGACPARSRRPHPWTGGLLCGLGIAFAPGTLAFLAAMLAPALLVRVFERRPERSTALPVLLAGIAATAEPALRLWHAGPPPVSAALDLLCDPHVLAPAWLAAGVAWLASELMTFAAGHALALRGAHRLRRLDAEIGALTEEWSLPADPGSGG